MKEILRNLIDEWLSSTIYRDEKGFQEFRDYLEKNNFFLTALERDCEDLKNDLEPERIVELELEQLWFNFREED